MAAANREANRQSKSKAKCLVEKDGEIGMPLSSATLWLKLLADINFISIGIMESGRFKQCTNFTVEVLFPASSPETKSVAPVRGFVFKVVSSDGTTRYS